LISAVWGSLLDFLKAIVCCHKREVRRMKGCVCMCVNKEKGVCIYLWWWEENGLEEVVVDRENRVMWGCKDKSQSLGLFLRTSRSQPILVLHPLCYFSKQHLGPPFL
jgi:hypothetical protein